MLDDCFLTVVLQDSAFDRQFDFLVFARQTSYDRFLPHFHF